MDEERQLAARCKELTEKVLSFMRSDGYSGSLVDHKLIHAFHKLNEFCNETNSGLYTPKKGEQFLDLTEERNLKKQTINYYRNGIIRMNKALEGDYHWKPECKPSKPYTDSCFSPLLFKYEKRLIDSGKTRKNVRRHVHEVARFLKHCDTNGYKDISSLDVKCVYSGFESASSKPDFRACIIPFFKYIYRNEMISCDLSAYVPKASKHKSVPTVYSVEEIETVINAIDKKSRNGRRDYAIVLLAARTGLRSCDITNLKLENIDNHTEMISLIQRKTGVHLDLPLLDEVRFAIDDYIANERPKSAIPNVFLSTGNNQIHTLTSSCIYAIVSRSIDKSGIDVRGRKKGAHALRSSLASHLLEEGNNYSTIQRVLGQKNPESAKHYVRIELKKLKCCALTVPELPAECINYIRENH